MTPRFLGDPFAGRWRAALELEPRDLWIGVHWRPRSWGRLDVWICLVPMLPLHLWWVGPPGSLVERCREEGSTQRTAHSAQRDGDRLLSGLCAVCCVLCAGAKRP